MYLVGKQTVTNVITIQTELNVNVNKLRQMSIVINNHTPSQMVWSTMNVFA